MELNFTVETKDVLLDMIKRHNKMYRMGTPEISDAEYDAEIELLKSEKKKLELKNEENNLNVSINGSNIPNPLLYLKPENGLCQSQ